MQNALLSDKDAIKYKFRKYLGYSLDLDNPTTFNEKLQWLKIYDHSEALTITADKFLSRNYIAETIGDQYLIPLELETSDTDELIPDNLPDHPLLLRPITIVGDFDSQKQGGGGLGFHSKLFPKQAQEKLLLLRKRKTI